MIATQNRRQSVAEQSISALKGTEKSPQSQKSCKEAEIFVFTIEEAPQWDRSHEAA